MGLIVKIPTISLTTTTLPPTTTTTLPPTTTTFAPIIIITAQSVFVDGFGNGENYRFGDNSPVWGQGQGSVSDGLAGDILMKIESNNSIFDPNTGDFSTVFINLNIVASFENVTTDVTNTDRDVLTPRVLIDIPNSSSGNFAGVNSSFTPTDATLPVRLYGIRRLVVEFNDILSLAKGVKKTVNIVGQVVMRTVTSPIVPQLLFLSAGGVSVPDIYYGVTRDTPIGLINVKIRNIHGAIGSTVTQTKSIGGGNEFIGGTFSPNPIYDINGNSGHVILADTNLVTPQYVILDQPQHKNGVIIQPIQGGTTTTTTTTTLPPTATLKFVVASDPAPISSPAKGSVVSNNSFFSIYVRVTNFTFEPIPYRIELVTSNINTVGIDNVVGDVNGGGSPYSDGDVVVDTTILSGVDNLISGEFFNAETSQKAVSFQLYVDRNNNGVYVLQDTYSIQIEYVPEV